MASTPHSPNIQTRLANIYRELPDAQRAIADVLMGDPLLGALWGIESMAERAQVSVGSVMRFAKHLGYKGFSDFRDALREACSARSGDSELEQLGQPTDMLGTLAEVVKRDGDHMNRMIDRGMRRPIPLVIPIRPGVWSRPRANKPVQGGVPGARRQLASPLIRTVHP